MAPCDRLLQKAYCPVMCQRLFCYARLNSDSGTGRALARLSGVKETLDWTVGRGTAEHSILSLSREFIFFLTGAVQLHG